MFLLTYENTMLKTVIKIIYLGAFVKWRTHMRSVFANCIVNGVVHARSLCNCVLEPLDWKALEALDMRLSLPGVATVTYMLLYRSALFSEFLLASFFSLHKSLFVLLSFCLCVCIRLCFCIRLCLCIRLCFCTRLCSAFYSALFSSLPLHRLSFVARDSNIYNNKNDCLYEYLKHK